MYKSRKWSATRDPPNESPFDGRAHQRSFVSLTAIEVDDWQTQETHERDAADGFSLA